MGASAVAGRPAAVPRLRFDRPPSYCRRGSSHWPDDCPGWTCRANLLKLEKDTGRCSSQPFRVAVPAAVPDCLIRRRDRNWLIGAGVGRGAARNERPKYGINFSDIDALTAALTCSTSTNLKASQRGLEAKGETGQSPHRASPFSHP